MPQCDAVFTGGGVKGIGRVGDLRDFGFDPSLLPVAGGLLSNFPVWLFDDGSDDPPGRPLASNLPASATVAFPMEAGALFANGRAAAHRFLATSQFAARKARHRRRA